MLITEHTDLDALAERMGGATEAEASRMREILVRNGYFGHTEDIAEDTWLAFCEVAVFYAAKCGKR